MISSSNPYFFVVALILLVAELVYFRIALRYNIVDKPNDRSSHVSHAIRGGGIIFIIAILIWFYMNEFLWPWFLLGACAIAVISFMDDVISLNPFIRFLVQLVGVSLLFLQIGLAAWPVYLVLMAVITCIGTLNAFNFMDGINGITGIYALVSLASFGYVQLTQIPFSNASLMLIMSIAVLIFLFFNFRKRAVCFAGDVGSITIAFVLIFLLLQLIHFTNNFLWPLFFLVYGTDSIVTILYRIKRGENIFKPHRTHLYQYLSNELNWSHRIVSLVYGGTQLVINWIICYAIPRLNYHQPLAVFLLFIIIYLAIRTAVERRISKLKE